MARALGIELSETCLRLVELERTGRGIRLVRCDEVPVATPPPPAPDAPPAPSPKADALRQILSRARWSRDRTAVSVDSGYAIIRELSLPFNEPEHIRKVVKFELEGHIQNHSIEDLVVDFVLTGTVDKTTHLLTVAIPKTAIRETLGLLETVRIDPSGVDLDITALINALIQSGNVESDDPFLLIHGNGKFTKLALIQGKKPVDLRTIRFALASTPTPTAPAEKPVAAATAPDEPAPEPATFVILDRPLDKPAAGDKASMLKILSKEISRFLLSTAADVTPSHLLVSGEYDGADVDPILQEITGLAVRHPDYSRMLPAGGIPLNHGWTPQMGVALGLALKAADRDALGTDFRKEDFVYRKKFDLIKSAALTTLILINIFLGLFIWDRMEKKRELEKTHQAVLDRQKELFSKVFSDVKVDDPAKVFGRMKDLYRSEMQKAGAGDSSQQRSALLVWKDLAAAMNSFYQRMMSKGPDATSYIMLRQIDLMRQSSEMIRISGQTAGPDSARDVEELKNTIKTVTSFESAELTGFTAANEKFNFSINISMKKEPRREK